MTSYSQRLVILGGTGFVGSHLLPRLSAAGHQILLLSRNREKHRQFGVLPGVELRSADVYDRATLVRCLHGADAALNLVGILNESAGMQFRKAHVDLTSTLVAACREAGVQRLHQMSSLRAGEGASLYLITRGEAERVVRASGLAWTIYQPSVIFGRGDGLVTRFLALLRMLPVLPLARAAAKLQPVAVEDVCAAIEHCVTRNDGIGCSYELGGPEVMSLGEIVHTVCAAAGLHRWIVPLPDALGILQARLGEWLPGKPLSRDNFLSLQTDSVTRNDGLGTLGIDAQSFREQLPALVAPQDIRQSLLDSARSRLGH